MQNYDIIWPLPNSSVYFLKILPDELMSYMWNGFQDVRAFCQPAINYIIMVIVDVLVQV